jgi:hypothetical protein
MIGLAEQNCNDSNGNLPPCQGWYPGMLPAQNGWGTAFFHLLPYLEQGNLYNSSATTGPNPMGQNPGVPYFSSATGVGTQVFIGANAIKGYICPSDSTISGLYTDVLFNYQWAPGSYAGNFQALAAGTNTNQSYQIESNIPSTFADGTSNTILFTERLGVCVSNAQDLPRACLWDFWLPPSYLFGGSGHDYLPYIAIPTSTGNPTGIFQVQPAPGNCDPSRASTAHPSGIQVLLADGSVRLVAAGLSQPTWWAALTPAGGEVLGSDW